MYYIYKNPTNLRSLTLKKLKLIISWILILGILLLIGWTGCKALHWLRSIDSGLAATVITASAGLLGLLYSQWHSKSRDIAEGHRKYKIEVYNNYLDIVDDFFTAAKSDTTIDTDNLPDKLTEKIRKLNRGMIVWASPKVIRAWLKFRKATAVKAPNLLFVVDELLQAIRKDLGNSNFGLNRGDVIRFYLTDPDELKEE